MPVALSYNLDMKKIYIEISDICGLKCSFCPAPKGVRGEMDFGLFKDLCKQIASNKRLSNALLCLHILGDPLRHRQIEDFFMCAQEYGLKIDLVSSGFYPIPDFLLHSKALHQIAFSLDARLDKNNPKPKYYLDKIFKYCLKHQSEGARNFVNLRLQDGLLDSNKSVVLDILKFFNKLTDENIAAVFEQGARRIKLAEYIFLNITRSFEWAGFQKNHNSSFRKFCHGVSSQIGILANGSIVPCCMDSCGKIILGDANKQSLIEVLDSKLAREMIEAFKNGNPIHKICQTCTFPSTL